MKYSAIVGDVEAVPVDLDGTHLMAFSAAGRAHVIEREAFFTFFAPAEGAAPIEATPICRRASKRAKKEEVRPKRRGRPRADAAHNGNGLPKYTIAHEGPTDIGIQNRVLAALKKKPGCVSDLCEATELEPKQVSNALLWLRRKGAVLPPETIGGSWRTA